MVGLQATIIALMRSPKPGPGARSLATLNKGVSGRTSSLVQGVRGFSPLAILWGIR